VISREEWVADRTAFGRGEASVLGPLARQFTDLTRRLLSATTVAEVLDQVAHAAAELVPGVDMVSVTLRSPDGSFHTPVETDPVATRLDELQYATGEGPCIDAASASGPGHVRCEDLVDEPAWPTFGPVAAEHGVRSVLAIALLPEASPYHYSGALNLYSHQPHGLDRDAYDVALLLAAYASLAIADTAAVSRGELTATQLRRAIESRDVIGQAKGILMQRRGIDAEEAFDLLRRFSQELNVKLAEVAALLAGHHTELDHIGRPDSPSARV
jgi:GAF domain-containing protein